MTDLNSQDITEGEAGITSTWILLQIADSGIDKRQAPVVQRVNSTIYRINRYSADSIVCFANPYPMDSDLSGAYRYPAFEQLSPGCAPSKAVYGRVSAGC